MKEREVLNKTGKFFKSSIYSIFKYVFSYRLFSLSFGWQEGGVKEDLPLWRTLTAAKQGGKQILWFLEMEWAGNVSKVEDVEEEEGDNILWAAYTLQLTRGYFTLAY